MVERALRAIADASMAFAAFGLTGWFFSHAVLENGAQNLWLALFTSAVGTGLGLLLVSMAFDRMDPNAQRRTDFGYRTWSVADLPVLAVSLVLCFASFALAPDLYAMVALKGHLAVFAVIAIVNLVLRYRS